jgi:hypothetical protein
MDAWKVACRLSNSVLHAVMKALVGTLARPIKVVVRNRSAAPGLILVIKAVPSSIKALAGNTSVTNPARPETIKVRARP